MTFYAFADYRGITTASTENRTLVGAVVIPRCRC